MQMIITTIFYLGVRKAIPDKPKALKRDFSNNIDTLF